LSVADVLPRDRRHALPEFREAERRGGRIQGKDVGDALEGHLLGGGTLASTEELEEWREGLIRLRDQGGVATDGGPHCFLGVVRIGAQGAGVAEEARGELFALLEERDALGGVEEGVPPGGLEGREAELARDKGREGTLLIALVAIEEAAERVDAPV